MEASIYIKKQRMREDGDMRAPMGEGLKEFFNSKDQRESTARVTRVKKECVETQAQREARLMADHDFDDCEFAKAGDCWICDMYGEER